MNYPINTYLVLNCFIGSIAIEFFLYIEERRKLVAVKVFIATIIRFLLFIYLISYLRSVIIYLNS